MGFLKFLKREKKKESLDELDLPPAPPPLEGFEETMPEFPDFGEEKVYSPKELPEFKFPEMEEIPSQIKEEKVPEFPSFPEIEEKMPTIPPISAPPMTLEPISTSQIMPEPKQEGIAQEERPMPSDIYPKIERRLFTHEKRVLKERPTGKTIYVRIDRFKTTLGSINMVRNDLRKSEEALMKLENIKSAKDKSFDKMKSSLDDLQRKLIFVDKTLFKGE